MVSNILLLITLACAVIAIAIYSFSAIESLRAWYKKSNG